MEEEIKYTTKQLLAGNTYREVRLELLERFSIGDTQVILTKAFSEYKKRRKKANLMLFFMSLIVVLVGLFLSKNKSLKVGSFMFLLIFSFRFLYDYIKFKKIEVPDL